jgi:hypothetical protein
MFISTVIQKSFSFEKTIPFRREYLAPKSIEERFPVMNLSQSKGNSPGFLALDHEHLQSRQLLTAQPSCSAWEPRGKIPGTRLKMQYCIMYSNGNHDLKTRSPLETTRAKTIYILLLLEKQESSMIYRYR